MNNLTVDSSSYAVRAKGLRLQFKPNEEKIDAFIMASNRQIVNMSITEFAEKCGVSEASVVRFSKKLGYKGFQAMKINLAQETIEPTQQIFEQVTREDTVHSITEKVFRASAQAIHDTMSILNTDAIEQAVHAIASAKRLLFFGIGGSASVASDAQHKFIKIGYLPLCFSDNNLQSMVASVLTPEDVLVAISHSGSSSSLIEAVSIAKESGATVITISKFGKSPMLKYCDIALFTSSTETAFKSEAMSSRIAELTLLDALFVGVSFEKYDMSWMNLKKTRRALDSKKY